MDILGPIFVDCGGRERVRAGEKDGEIARVNSVMSSTTAGRRVDQTVRAWRGKLWRARGAPGVEICRWGCEKEGESNGGFNGGDIERVLECESESGCGCGSEGSTREREMRVHRRESGSVYTASFEQGLVYRVGRHRRRVLGQSCQYAFQRMFRAIL